MENSINSLITNLISEQIGKKGITPSIVDNSPEIIVVQNNQNSVNYVNLDYQQDPPSHSEELVQIPVYPELATPDSTSFNIIQTVVSPTNSSDISTVSVIIELSDIPNATEYLVRWVTA